MIVGLSFNHFGQDEELLVDAAVAEVVVAEEAVEPVVAVVQDQPRSERAVGIVATKFFPAPLKEKTKQKVFTEMDICRSSYQIVKEKDR
jgi:hypothetical protein